jgi:predicted ATPase/DNA-binding SARP family transcriptional activator
MMTEPEKQHSPPLELRLFGTFEARVQGEPLPPLRYRKELWLLALLALHHDRDVSRDWLASTFWPDNEESQARFYLRKSLSNLRNALGAEGVRLLSPTPRTLRLDLSNAFCDVRAFDNAIKQKDEGGRMKDEKKGIHPLREAVALYRGPLLMDCSDEWVIAEREARAQTYLAVLETLAQQALGEGSPADATRWLRLIIATDPYRESACAALMQALADCGDRAAVTQVYRDLRLLLRRDLNADPSPEIEQLYDRLRRQERTTAVVAAPVSQTETAARRHLPVPLTDLVGREEEQEAVVGWLSRRRLVTLTGPGGIGKTRLAIAAAEAALSQFPQGVWFVDLAAVTDPNLLASVVAKTLGIVEEKEKPPAETLQEQLAGQTLLLVLDNCEHLLEASAWLVSSLLSTCPELRILATSRQSLGVTGEQNYRVHGLSLPPPPLEAEDAGRWLGEKEPTALLEFAAARLFVERAIEADPAFRLSRRHLGAVTNIVRQLDGIPLAMEMAAARLRSLTVQEIETRLTDRLRLLTTGSRAARVRQQTLRATIDWSYDLLSEAERVLLRRLSVFVGGWTAEAAEAVCGNDERGMMIDELTTGVDIHHSSFIIHHSSFIIHHSYVPDLLMSLVEKSLVVCDTNTDETHYRMLETIREYARERLETSGEAWESRGRHLAFYQQLAARVRQHLGGSEDDVWLDRLDRAYENVRAALNWSRESDAPVEGLQMTRDLNSFWMSRGYLSEGRRYCAALLAHPGAQERTEARALFLCGAGWLAHHQNAYEEGRFYGEEALSICREQGTYRGISRALGLLCAVSAEQSDLEAARRFAEENLALRREEGTPMDIATGLNLLGEIVQLQGDFQAARSAVEEALALRREAGDQYLAAASLYTLGRVAYDEGDLAAARRNCEEALFLFQESGYTFWTSACAIQLGWIVLSQGRVSEAVRLCRAGLEAQREAKGIGYIVVGLECLSEAACRQEQWERAGCLYGAARGLQQHISGAPLAVERRNRERLEQALQRAITEESYRRHLAEGAAMRVEQALALALFDP